MTHTYTIGGTFTAVLRVTDDDEETATNSKTIYVSPPELPVSRPVQPRERLH
ncbi:hypothetical protein ACFLSZ_07560 [Candidatus Bipolaricaulota bacterium]